MRPFRNFAIVPFFTGMMKLSESPGAITRPTVSSSTETMSVGVIVKDESSPMLHLFLHGFSWPASRGQSENAYWVTNGHIAVKSIAGILQAHSPVCSSKFQGSTVDVSSLPFVVFDVQSRGGRHA